ATSQDTQLYDLTNIIVVGCKTAYGFGNASRPDDDCAEINIRGGYTFGCPQYLKAIGTQTVVHIASANVISGRGNGTGAWTSLPAVVIESQGATVTQTGGNMMANSITSDCAYKITAIASTLYGANFCGNITISNVLMEIASAIAFV
ncbi:hypothetical protein K7461_29875, partial [Pseudomonas fluorescens]